MTDLQANPAPLGLMGFGMTTILLKMEYKNGNTFGTTAFISYGSFWLSLVALWAIPKFTWGTGFATDKIAVGFYLLCWGIFTLLMFFGTLKTNRALQFVFASLAILFFLLAAGDFTGNAMITQIAGYEGIICGASAFCLAMTEIINGAMGKTVLPICPVKK